MTIDVLLFGAEAEAAGRRHVTLDTDVTQLNCAALRSELAEAEPSLRPHLASCRIAINHDFADEDAVIHDGDEVALIGMVSGG